MYTVCRHRRTHWKYIFYLRTKILNYLVYICLFAIMWQYGSMISSSDSGYSVQSRQWTGITLDVSLVAVL